ncbi:serine/threonine-protein kinase [Methylobacterium aquaticum]|uniref:Serine/threonine protein kinase n=1 Tax=Methylobacterium aquaticum TaxID=270351 RepID=A0A0J6SXQ0_9HYPH|nr:serine/threonine-protein kinase [Methylobacterium aquaticum]KMO38108.1 serine/threonine protein kinase [Methylobacterium aquaticum]
MTEETVFLPQPSRAFIQAGTRLNDTYVVRSLIAAGGMGEVYKGEALGTGDAVAIKVIKPELARNAAALALFRREASALHHLNHEAIVRYFVFSIDAKLDLPYLAMEFVDGVLLSERLKDEALDTPALSLLLRRLAAGLQAAHELGIIHRDVSPDNVILPGGNVARAKLIDFGIARAPNQDGTVIGDGFAGKYAYVSPEQLGLYGGEVTPKSDIYSLGLLLVHAARGQALDMGSTHLEVIEKRRRVPDLTGIDERIRPVLTAMLQPNPKDRPADMAATAALLPTDEPPRQRLGPLLATAAGLATAALLGGAAVLLLARSNPPPPRPVDPPLVAPRADTGPTATPPALAQDTRQDARQDIRQDTRTDDVARRKADFEKVARERAAQYRAAQDERQIQEESRARDERPAVIPLQDPGPNPDEPSTPPRPETSRAAAANADEVERFVRNYEGGECFFATAVSVQPPNVTVEAFGASTQPFMAFDTAFQRRLGIDPQITLHQVMDAQCPLVDFLARQFPLRDARAASLTITSDQLRNGQELSGVVEAATDRSIELLLVSDDGRVSNLGRSMRRTGDAARFTLKVEGSGSPKPQLLLALTSQKPLSSLRGGGTARASQLFRLIGDELDRDPRPAGIAIGYFKLGS